MADFEQFEYCYLVEDTDPEATSMKIFVPKLMGNMSMSNKTSKKNVNKQCLMNDDDSGVDSSVQTQNFIVGKVQDPYMHKHSFHDCPGNCPNVQHGNTCGSESILSPCPHFHHDHHFPHLGEHGKIPAGAQLICCIMNKNIKDIIVTRMWCRW